MLGGRVRKREKALCELWYVSTTRLCVTACLMAGDITSARQPTDAAGSSVVSNHIDVSALVAEAQEAFKKGSDDRGIAFLSAALVHSPSDKAALAVYERLLASRRQAALQAKNWELARLQAAACDQIARDGIRAAQTVADVDRLLSLCRQAEAWDKELAEIQVADVRKALASIKTALGSKDADHEALAQQLSDIATDQLPENVAAEVASLAIDVARKQEASHLARLEKAIAALKSDAEAPALSETDLQLLRVRADKLLADLLECLDDAANATPDALASLRLVMSQLDQRLQVFAVRRVQTIADADALNALNKAQQLLDTATAEEAAADKTTFQSRGEKLAEAETLLSQIDQLSSAEVQKKAREMLASIRSHAVQYRVLQQRAYNRWAVEVLQEALTLYKDGDGWVRDNKGRFRRVLRDKVGQIDPAVLHPVVYSLYSDLFQRLMNKLDVEERGQVAADMLVAKNRELSEF